MKKIGITLVVLLAIVGVVFGGMYMMNLNKEKAAEGTNSKNETKKGEVKFINSKLEEATITQKYKAYINGKNIDVDVNFNFYIQNIDPEENQGYSRIERVVGKFKDIVLFEHEEKTNSQSQKAELFETSKIDKVYNGDFFKVVRGTDGKDYLAIATHIYDIDYDHLKENSLYILNDNLSVINKNFSDPTNCSKEKQVMMIHPGTIGLLSDNNIWYKSQFPYDNHRKNYTSLKIMDDKIYYLYHNINIDTSGDYGTIEERIYTISNDKLEYTIGKTYKAESFYGERCS